MRQLTLLFSVFIAMQQPALAQLYAAEEGSVVYGHHHINSADIPAQQRFWIEGLGGSPLLFGPEGREIVGFPNVLIFFTEHEPSGGTRGTIVNHVGFETTDILAAVAHLQSMGYRMITREELPDSYSVVDGIGKREGGNTIAFVLGPDDIKVELIENKNNQRAIQLHHVHWSTTEGEKMQAWYAANFGAAKGSRIGQPAADLPGVNLTFAPSTSVPTPTKGTVLDHIGFEIENLQAFCQNLEAKGIIFDRPYSEIASLGIAYAYLTDPWGTYIELTEGLDLVK